MKSTSNRHHSRYLYYVCGVSYETCHGGVDGYCDVCAHSCAFCVNASWRTSASCGACASSLCLLPSLQRATYTILCLLNIAQLFFYFFFFIFANSAKKKTPSMSQFPSPADSVSSSSGFQTSPKNTSSLYPDLSTTDPEEDDILAALEAPSPRSKRPPRPPPPRSQSLPSSCGLPQPSPIPDTVAQSLPPSHAHCSKSHSESDLYVPLPLRPHEVRWFYQEPGKYWQPFNGNDSLVLEDCYQHLISSQHDESSSTGHEVTVLGDMYIVNVEEKTCKPVYWAG